MHFIYFLRSQTNPAKTYIGYTNNFARRLQEHNSGQSIHTSRFMPWGLEALVMADTEEIAVKVEEYFKNNSGQEKFRNYAAANTGHTNPINGFFESLAEGRKFGRSSFMVKANNDGAVLFTGCT